jgi:hypothetical protein
MVVVLCAPFKRALRKIDLFTALFAIVGFVELVRKDLNLFVAVGAFTLENLEVWLPSGAMLRGC